MTTSNGEPGHGSTRPWAFKANCCSDEDCGVPRKELVYKTEHESKLNNLNAINKYGSVKVYSTSPHLQDIVLGIRTCRDAVPKGQDSSIYSLDHQYPPRTPAHPVVDLIN